MIEDPSVALGWQLLQTGNLAAADDVAHQLLKRGLSDDLVPLVGAIRLQQGRFSEAAPMFDYTHLGPKGSAFFARMVADELTKAVPDLQPYVVSYSLDI